MAFIAPGLVRAAVEGRLPRGIGFANLRDAPVRLISIMPRVFPRMTRVLRPLRQIVSFEREFR